MNCHCKNSFSVIQGDDLNITINIDSPNGASIEAVNLVCKSLDIDEQLHLILENGTNWSCDIAGSTTRDFNVGTFTFDVTVIEKDGTVSTILHNKPLRVIYKYNK